MEVILARLAEMVFLVYPVSKATLVRKVHPDSQVMVAVHLKQTPEATKSFSQSVIKTRLFAEKVGVKTKNSTEHI